MNSPSASIVTTTRLMLFRSLLGIADDITAPSYAEFYTCEKRPTISSRFVRQPDRQEIYFESLIDKIKNG